MSPRIGGYLRVHFNAYFLSFLWLVQCFQGLALANDDWDLVPRAECGEDLNQEDGSRKRVFPHALFSQSRSKISVFI